MQEKQESYGTRAASILIPRRKDDKDKSTVKPLYRESYELEERLVDLKVKEPYYYYKLHIATYIQSLPKSQPSAVKDKFRLGVNSSAN